MEKIKIYRIMAVILAAIVIAEGVYIYRLKSESEPAYRAEYSGSIDGIGVSLTISKGYYEYKNGLTEWEAEKGLPGFDRLDGEVFIWGEVCVDPKLTQNLTDSSGISVGDGNIGLYTEFIKTKYDGENEMMFFNYEVFEPDMTKIDGCTVKLGENRYAVELARTE